MNDASQTRWPELPTAAWRETYATLHLWTQIVGKIRLARAPWLNHSWHVALYVTARGLTTSPIPDGSRTFQIDLDFIDHALRVSTSDGTQRQFALAGQSVASFHASIIAALAELGTHIAIDEMPNELPEPIRFSEDNKHATYDPHAVRRAIRGVCLTSPTRSRAKPIPTRKAAPASGPAAVRSIIPRSIAMPIPNLQGFAPPRCGPRLPSLARHSANSSCPMTPCVTPRSRIRCCSNSCKAAMRPRPMPPNGIATRWNARPVSRACHGRSNSRPAGAACR